MDPIPHDDQKTLGELCDEFREYYRANPGKDAGIITIPDIFSSSRYKETFINAWLAYLLDPAKNGFGSSILQALLNCIDEECLIEDGNVDVQAENTFSNGRRIDILITNDDYLIGIENKINSPEGISQTQDYWEELARDAKGLEKTPIGIFLTPRGTPPKCRNFHAVSYREFLAALQAIPHDHLRDSRSNFFFYEFTLYVKEYLVDIIPDTFPTIDDDVLLYIENKAVLNRVLKRYSSSMEDIALWLQEQVSIISEGKWHTNFPKSHYWQFWRGGQWPSIDFHFELLWDEGCSEKRRIGELTGESEGIHLQAHLEGQHHKDVRDALKDFLGKANRFDPGISVCVDFSTQEKAIASINWILKTLESGEFLKMTDIVDRCMQNKEEVSF